MCVCVCTRADTPRERFCAPWTRSRHGRTQVREVTEQVTNKSDLRFQAQAIMCLQEAAEAYLVLLFEDACVAVPALAPRFPLALTRRPEPARPCADGARPVQVPVHDPRQASDPDEGGSRISTTDPREQQPAVQRLVTDDAAALAACAQATSAGQASWTFFWFCALDRERGPRVCPRVWCTCTLWTACSCATWAQALCATQPSRARRSVRSARLRVHADKNTRGGRVASRATE